MVPCLVFSSVCSLEKHMKNSSDFINSKNAPIYLLCVSIIPVILVLYSERFGTYSQYGSGGAYSESELCGIVFPLCMMIFPIFIKGIRENFWSKRNLIITIIVLIINILLLSIYYANKEYYWSAWFSEPWTRSNCPPIRWDFWNIIGKSA